MTDDGRGTYGADIYTEAEGSDDTLANLGPLRGLAGIWEGIIGADQHPVGPGSDIDGPVANGMGHSVFVEHYEAQPIDGQTNGPQLFFGLRYHSHVVKPGEIETFHDQVGYWLWEPHERRVTLSIAIPRGQVVLAAGPAEPDATEFEVRATRGSEVHGILSNPFLDTAFRTVEFTMRVAINPDGTWSYFEDTVMAMADRPEPVHHTDENTLSRVAEPTPNPVAQAALEG